MKFMELTKEYFESHLDEKISELALIIAKGFEDVYEKFIQVDNRFNGIDGKLNGVESRLDGVESRLDGVESKLDRLEQGQENILLRLDNTAHRFELREVQARLLKVEKKIGIN